MHAAPGTSSPHGRAVRLFSSPQPLPGVAQPAAISVDTRALAERPWCQHLSRCDPTHPTPRARVHVVELLIETTLAVGPPRGLRSSAPGLAGHGFGFEIAPSADGLRLEDEMDLDLDLDSLPVALPGEHVDDALDVDDLGSLIGFAETTFGGIRGGAAPAPPAPVPVDAGPRATAQREASE